MSGTGPSPLGVGGTGLGSAVRGAPRHDAVADPRAELPAPGSPARGDRGSSAVERRDGAREQSADTVPAPDRPFADLLVPVPPTAAAAAPAEPAAEAVRSPGELLVMLEGHWSGAHAAGGSCGDPGARPGPMATPDIQLRAQAPALPTAGPAASIAAQPAPDATQAAASRATANAGAQPFGAVGDDAATLQDPQALVAAREPGVAADARTAVEAGGIGPAGTPTLAATRSPAAMALPPLPMPAEPAAGFDDGFGTRIAWVVEQRLGHAEIRLNPEHMGRIDVRVQLDGDRVHAEFHSAHAEVRQAIEASLPRLRELLDQHGLQLGQADVGQRQAGEGSASGAGHGTADHDRADAGKPAPAPTQPAVVRLRGLLDEYA